MTIGNQKRALETMTPRSRLSAISSAYTSPDTTSLRRCVGNEETFLRDYWSQMPFIYTEGRSYLDLLSLTDVDHIISSTFLRWPALRMAKDGKPLEPGSFTKSTTLGGTQLDDTIDPGRVFAAFYGGATIVLQGLQKYWPPLTHFCSELETVLTHPVQCNAYITPSHSQGFGIHYDTHDVLVLQTTGTKHWKVYERLVDHPLSSQEFNEEILSPEQRQGDPQLELELNTGNCLYLPGGYLHQASSTDQVSIHLTLGISPYTWSDVVKEILQDAYEDVIFREPLPVGFANDTVALSDHIDQRLNHLSQWFTTIDRDNLARRIASKFWLTRSSDLAGQLQQLMELDQLTDDSLIIRRPHCIMKFADPSTSNNTLSILLSGRRLELPSRLKPALDTILERSHFHIKDLSDSLNEESRMVLVRRLIREGLLEAVADTSDINSAP